MMINVTSKLARAKKTTAGVVVGLRGDDPAVLDGMEWRLADQPHPAQPAGCVTIWHWCSGSYRWLDADSLSRALAGDRRSDFASVLTEAIQAQPIPVGSFRVDDRDDVVFLLWSCPSSTQEMYGDEPWSDWGGNAIIAAAGLRDFDESGIDDNGDQWVLWHKN